MFGLSCAGASQHEAGEAQILESREHLTSLRPPFSAPPLYFAEEMQVGHEHRILLFEVGAKVKKSLGKIIYSVQTNSTVHIDNVWVAESIRTLGFGRILLQQALAAAVDMGSKRVLLEAEEDTRRHNHLVSFYLREGFTQLGDESFVKYIPHQDGCFRKVPMHLQLETFVARPRFFSGDQVLPVQLVRKRGLCLGVHGSSLDMIRLELDNGTRRGYGDWEDETNERYSSGKTFEPPGAAAPIAKKAQLWLLNRHEDESDDEEGGDDEDHAAASADGSSGSKKGRDSGVFSATLMNAESGFFLTALPDGRMCADRREEGAWEDLAVVELGGGRYALRTAHGSFLGFDLRSNELRCFPFPSAWRLSAGRGLEWGGEGPGPYDACAYARATQGWDYVETMVRQFEGIGVGDEGGNVGSRSDDQSGSGSGSGGVLTGGSGGSSRAGGGGGVTPAVHKGPLLETSKQKEKEIETKKSGFGTLAKLSLYDALELLMDFHHPLHPESELSQGHFTLLCAEVARNQGLPDWVQLMLLVQGCAELPMFPHVLLMGKEDSSTCREGLPEAQTGGGAAAARGEGTCWVAVVPEQEAWLVGCPLPHCLPHAATLNALHPDAQHPVLGGAGNDENSNAGGGGGGSGGCVGSTSDAMSDTAMTHSGNDDGARDPRNPNSSSFSFGKYTLGCGVSSGAIQPCWTKFEYAFRFLRHNRCSAPWEALCALRLTPLRCWHSRGAYAQLSDSHGGGPGGGGRSGSGGHDAAVLPWAQVMDECISEAREMAAMTHPTKAPVLCGLWESHYCPVVAKYLSCGVLDW